MTVLLMLVALSLFLLLETALRRRLPVAPGTTAIHTKQGLSPIFLPSGLVLASNHMWTKEETDGSVTLGLDAFLSRLFGTPDEVLLPEQDGILEHDTSPIFLRHREKTLRLQVPVAGRVTAVNSRVLDNHALVAKDPYGEGWLLKVRRVQSLDRSESFAVADPGRWLREQLDRAIAFFRTRSGAPALATLPDGGVFTEGLLANLGPAVWDEFNKTFATLRKKD
jgi:glycine cleavage system H protein